MDALYPLFIAFTIIFISELGDKTQLLMLSFASKSRTRNILIGIAIGTFFSHGIAIIFGSKIGTLNSDYLLFFKIITYITFIIIGIYGLLPKKVYEKHYNNALIKKLGKLNLSYIFIVAICIMIGEIGDKTFLASIGLGLEYNNFKIALITGCVLGMIISNYVVILFGKYLENHIPQKYIQLLSSNIFILFGLIGLIMLFKM